MREAVGGSILFYIILGFIGVFIVFIAIVLNYASAYRTNNYVVNMIEQYEGTYDFGRSGDENDEETLVGYLKRNKYYNGLKVTCDNVGGINPRGAVFNVTTYINFYIPLIEVGFPIAIKNDTKTIYGVNCNDDIVTSTGCWSVKGFGKC